MKFETLNEFIKLAKCRTFSRAAKELFLSQPSLSTHIATMEKDLGFELFERGATKLSLTPAGVAFLEYAQTLVSTYDEARDTCSAISREQPPIRMLSISPDSELFKYLSKLENPKITFVDIDINTTLLDALIAGDLDVGTCADYTRIPATREKAEAAGIAFVPSGYDRGAIAVMNTHPLAAKGALAKEDVRGATVSISSYAHFDDWAHIVKEMVGDDAGLKFHLKPFESAADQARENLGNLLHICGRDAIDQQYFHRNDIKVFTQLDGKDLLFPTGIAYRTNCKNKLLPVLIDEIKNIIS